MNRIWIFFVTFVCLAFKAQAAPMTFEFKGTGGNCNGCSWVAAEGEITSSTPSDFDNFYASSPIAQAQPIVFNSPGGDLDAGLQLGYRIRRLGLQTSVGKTVPDGFGQSEIRDDAVCASACSWAFLGGVVRNALPDQIGVHQFYYSYALLDPDSRNFSANDLAAGQRTMSKLINYAVAMNIDPRFVAASSAVNPDNIYFLNDNDLDVYRVRWNPYLLTSWKIEAYKKGVVAYSKTNDEKTTAMLFCDAKKRIKFQFKTPAVLDPDWYLEMRDSMTEINMFGLTFDRSVYSFDINSGIVSLTLNIKKLDQNSFRLDNLQLKNNAAHAYYGFFEQFIITDKNLLMNARVALNNCL